MPDTPLRLWKFQEITLPDADFLAAASKFKVHNQHFFLAPARIEAQSFVGRANPKTAVAHPLLQ